MAKPIQTIRIIPPVLSATSGYGEKRDRHAAWAELHEGGLSYGKIAARYGVQRETVRHGVDAYLNRQPRLRRSA